MLCSNAQQSIMHKELNRLQSIKFLDLALSFRLLINYIKVSH